MGPHSLKVYKGIITYRLSKIYLGGFDLEVRMDICGLFVLGNREIVIVNKVNFMDPFSVWIVWSDVHCN
jgi:hypothetical protein